ncbi:MAG: hypothetical protein U0Q18_02375 [Bryobacteraceae bacterium]
MSEMKQPESAEVADQPAVDEQQALVRIVLQQLVRKHSKRRKPILEYMLKNLVPPGGKSEKLTPRDVLIGIKEQPTMQRVNNLRSTKNHLNDDLSVFFEKGEGRSQKWRMYFEPHNYRPLFKRNTPPPCQTDYLAQFWAAHLSPKPTQILYPEPCFFIDAQNTYLRNVEVNSMDDRARFSYLADRTQSDSHVYMDHLKTSYSYVPAGAVSAMLCVMKCFREQWNRYLEAQPFLPFDPVPNASDLIVLGTSTSMRAVATLERHMPIHTGSKSVTIAGEEPVFDTEYLDEQGRRLFLKWGTVTRRRDRYSGQVSTILSAHHGRAVEAIASFVTKSQSLLSVAGKLQHPQIFPESFQALFSVEMEETPRGPVVTYIAVDRVIDVTEARTSGR